MLAVLLAHLADPPTFGGDHRLPGVTRDDPAFLDNTYWRGRIWPPLNFWVWQGLRRMDRVAEASGLAASSYALSEGAWARRLCPENYNAVTGEPLDQPDTEGFYGWGALMPAMAVGAIMDVSPWSGWSLTNDGVEVALGPLESPVGPICVAVSGGILSLSRGSTVLLETDLRGRLSALRIEPQRLSFVLDRGSPDGFFLRLPGRNVADLLRDGSTSRTHRPPMTRED